MKFLKEINYALRIFSFLISTALFSQSIVAEQFFILNSDHNSTDSSGIIAVVGDKIITAEDFIKSYSFGPSLLKKAGNAKSAYLDAMINEELLSYKLKDGNLVNDPSIQKMLRLIEQELVVEEFFKAEVSDRIKVSDEEIKEAVEKSFQKVKLNYFFSTDSAEAESTYIKLQEGYSFDTLPKEYELLPAKDERSGTTGFLSYGELEEPINNIAFNLIPFKISEIIAWQDGYYILQVVDKKKEILSPADYRVQYKKFENILYNKKGSELGKKFVKDFMDPKNISLDAKMFSLLVNELYPFFRVNNTSVKKELTLLEKLEIFPADILQKNLNENAEEPIVKFNEGSFTIKELFYHLSYRPLDLSAGNINDLAEKLRIAVGITLRDIFMEDAGKERSYHKKPEIIAELESWQNKMITDKYIQGIKKKNIVSETEVKEYFKNNFEEVTTLEKIGHNLTVALSLYKTREELLSEIKVIRKEVPVKINERNLENIYVAEPKYGRLPEVKLFKLGLPYFRLAFPVPDIVWGANSLLTD